METQPQGDRRTARRTSVMSLEAAAALMCRLGWRMELLQSKARANVPTALEHKHSDVSQTEGARLKVHGHTRDQLKDF